MMQKIKNNIFKTEIFLYNKIELIILAYVIMIIFIYFPSFFSLSIIFLNFFYFFYSNHEFKSKLPLSISNTRIFE